MDLGNRRRISRWEINHKAKVRFAGSYAPADCFIKEISLKGFQAHLAFRLETDTFKELKLYLAVDSVLDAEVWVAWHRTVHEKNMFGFYFTRISEQDREKIYYFVQHHYPRQLYGRSSRTGDSWDKGVNLSYASLDKRVFERFPLRYSVRYLDASRNREGAGMSFDVSAKGLGITTTHALEAKTPLELWLNVPDKGEPLYLRGEVVWSAAAGTHEFRAGINLDRADLMGLSRVMRS